MTDEATLAATQAYASETQDASMAATQAYPAQAEANGTAPAGEEPPKKKRGKPKDDMAPPKPKNPYQRVTGDARAKIKEQRPELAMDLKGMALALKEEWEKVPEEEKERMQQEYQQEMEVWRPKWAAYKQTQHYKEFFEIKQDWIDARARKKLVKKLNKDAPKRPKSGYMLFAGEIRERVQKEVMDAGGGMGDIGKKISEEWGALSEEKKAEYAAQSAEMKKKFDVEIVEYKKGTDWANFCTEKAKMESKQMQKKLIRTKLDEAPKKAPSAFALFRSEVMASVVEQNKGLGAGELGKKVAELWVKVDEEKKEEYRKQSSKLKEEYDQKLLDFKREVKYTQYLQERQQVKAKENKALNLRELPKRPRSAFAMYAEEHKSEVEPGKGEGKGRDALMKKYMQATEDEKAPYIAKEKELKDQWMRDMQAFKEGEKFTGFQSLEKKIKMEFMTEAMKVVTLRFLSDAPQQPPKSPFAVFVHGKRKAAGTEGPPKDKQARIEEMATLKAEWSKVDLQTKFDCEVQRKESLAKWKEDAKEYMAREKWQEYIKECKRLKVPVQSILKEKKKVLRKLKNGMAIHPLPEKPEGIPRMPPTAMKLFAREKLKEINDKAQIPEMWKQLDEESKKKYQEVADEKMKAFRTELKEFAATEEGRNYYKQVKSIGRRNRIARAKDTFLTDLPKKPAPALISFMKSKVKEVKREHPQAKGGELRKILMDKWEGMDASEKEPILAEAKAKQEEFQKSMDEFKRSENWMKFKRAVKVKAKGKAKAKGKGPLSLPKPKKPESAPQRPLDALRAYCKEMAGSGKGLADLAKTFRELPEDDRADREKQAKEAMEKYQEEAAAFDKTPEGRKYAHAIASYERRKRLTIAKIKFLKDEPKRPQSAFMIFVNEKRPEVTKDNPDLKGLGPVQAKLGEMWKELSDEERAAWSAKEAEAKEEHEKAMEEFHKSPNYKKYMAIVSRLSGKPKAKAKGKAMGGALMPAAPESLPKKPPSGFFIFLSEQRTSGMSGNNAKLTEAWRELGAEGQKKYMDDAAERLSKYEKDMKEFNKSAEGKKYFRLKSAAEKKNKIHLAKKRFLGSEDAPKEPKRPPSTYFLFVQEKRSTLPPGKIGDVAKQLTEMWSNLSAEEKAIYEKKTEALKEQYEKELAEYKNSANFKKYDKALKAITKKPKAKAKPAEAKGGRGRGGGGKGRGRGGDQKPADSDSDSDVMGSDDDERSSSSDSDTD
mmetsp:Transcript_36179/g.115064  ORF Transcript_36179/g.115064 Transcript_36179/m.115064 type:complete len:1222 (-) Transcript_36179:108-3773(-)